MSHDTIVRQRGLSANTSISIKNCNILKNLHMLNLFNKKIMDKIENADIENDNLVIYCYSNNLLSEEYRKKIAFWQISIDAYIHEWNKFDGDYVSKGESVCKLYFYHDGSHLPINLYSEADGVIEICKDASGYYGEKEYLKEGDVIFKIYKEPFEEKKIELKNKRFYNIPQILIDDFKKSKVIKWSSVAGETKKYEYDSKIYDSIILKDEKRKKLFFTFNNIENKDYILFKSAIKEFKLNPGTKILFLFSNEEILTFEIINKSYKYSESSDWGNIFENKIAITLNELELFENFDLIKWQIEFIDSEIKISGKVDSVDTQFSIKKFTKDYKEIVQSEVIDYQPLLKREANSSIATSENCYVYLMIDHVNKYHKIGISNKPEYREKTFQSEKPTIELICNKRFPNRKIANSFEQALHQAYSDKRIRGEWFSLDFNDVEDIKESLK